MLLAETLSDIVDFLWGLVEDAEAERFLRGDFLARVLDTDSDLTFPEVLCPVASSCMFISRLVYLRIVSWM